MIVTLQDHEINDAIKQYVEKTIAIKEGNGITNIDFTAGRKDNGNTATITIEPVDEIKPVSAFKKQVNFPSFNVGKQQQVQEEPVQEQEGVVEESSENSVDISEAEVKQVTPEANKPLFSTPVQKEEVDSKPATKNLFNSFNKAS